MSADRNAFNAEVLACLSKDAGVVALLDCIAGHFPELEVFRENDDLVIKHGGRFLIVRRDGPDRFRTSDYVEAPTTNEVDMGGGVPHDVEGLFDKITGLAGV
ncbi:MAG: hypothetical protein K9G60_04445 [Pseudolabrys sp.]|nr:hypothetical protein [Pseudolabrys sp.]